MRLFFLLWTTALMAMAKPYNLLVIQTDEHHFKTLGCYGGKVVQTPNIDWIAQHGAIATSFYATTPVCSPSRAAFMSGLYPHKTPVSANNIPLDNGIVTFAEVLRRHGYATGYAGKWHLDGEGKPQWGPTRQFGWEDNRFMFNRGHWKKFTDSKDGPQVGARKNGEPNYTLDDANEETFATDWLTDKLIEFVNAKKGQPFCYMVSYPDPHGPNTVRAPYDTMYDHVQVPIPRSVNKTRAQTPVWAAKAPKITADTVRILMPKYYGMVKCLDDNIGRILSTLRRNGQLERTLIVFTSDHGDLCGEHGRLNKGVPFEGSARIPFLLYCPGKVPPGTVVKEALSCIDFLPTVTSLMKVKHRLNVDGRNAESLFTQVRGGEWEDIAFLRSTKSAEGWLCAVTDRYKLVYAASGKPWLFDLEQDPDEMKNFFSSPAHQKIVHRLTGALAGYAETHKDVHFQKPNIAEAMQAVLKAK